MLSLVAGGHVVPHAVLDDRPADAEGEVPLLEQLAGGGQAERLQLRAVVAAHHALAHAGQIRRTFEGVATALRDDAERGAADFDLAQPAGGRRHDFLCVRNIGDVGRDAAAAEPRAGVQPVHLHAAFVVAPARTAEHGHLRRDLDVRRAAANGDDARNQQRRGCPRACRWNTREHFIADRRLTSDALHIDDRRGAGHRERLGHSADGEVGINGRIERTRELDAVALHLVESRQGKRHRVRARRQIDDAEEAPLVADGGANFLDERRARGLDGHAGQRGTGGIPDGAGNRCLGGRRRGYEGHYCNKEHAPQTLTHSKASIHRCAFFASRSQGLLRSGVSLYQNADIQAFDGTLGVEVGSQSSGSAPADGPV